MSSEIIVNATGREIRVALMESGKLSELHIDRGRNRGFVGNVYLGKVVRVLPGMQASFVDIGLERAAFLYVGDIYPDFLDKPAERGGGDPEATIAEEGPRAAPKRGQPPIQDLLKEGQHIMVQVSKDPIGTKGARLTTHVTLPGRYIVYMPTVEHVGISRRIDREKERRRLRDLVEKNRPKGAGFIVRTVCADQPDAILKQDMDYLLRTWEKILEAAKAKKAPRLLHADYGLTLRFLRDNMTEDVRRVIVDTREEFDRVKGFLSDFMPRQKDAVQLYRGAEPVFDIYGVSNEIHRSMGRKVWLKSGGYLIIDQTEALTAIDINSGKFVGTSNLEDTTTQINVEAAREIVYQLRLRNIGGIIIIDFIDMDREANREKVYKVLEEEIRRDRARTNILKISELGLVEMTRKRVQEDLSTFLTEACYYCTGNGHLRSRETLCFDIFRAVQRESARGGSGDTVFVNAHPMVADMLYGEELETLEHFERKLSKQIVIRAMGHYHLERYEVYSR